MSVGILKIVKCSTLPTVIVRQPLNENKMGLPHFTAKKRSTRVPFRGIPGGGELSKDSHFS